MLLALSIGFVFNSDFSLAVIPLAILIIWITYKLPLFKRSYLPAFALFLLLILPQFVFEIRHDWVTLKTIPKTSQRFEISADNLPSLNWKLSINNFTRLFFTQPLSGPLKGAETYLHYLPEYPKPLFNGFSQFVILVLLVVSFYLTYRLKNKKLFVIWIFLLAFLLGNLLFSGITKAPYYQHYSAVALPIFCLVIGLPFWQLLKSRFSILTLFLLLSILSINLFTLINSRVKHPTYQKMKIVELIKPYLENKKFGFYSSGVRGGGMAYPFLFHNLHPVKSSYHDAWYWVYAAYSLFDAQPQVDWPKTIVVFKDTNQALSQKYEQEVKRVTFEDITVLLIDNSDKKFDPQVFKSI